ncbi:DoxX family protein [Fulvivirgaceae bacterium BMA12]|uniref:DoxX family protein n=1 Tax=Agaribacillus aureus TaxID=3051825 RepID=A0ABT8L4A6_9BACT|nr:DoxX family protein [Fulvivirgaceae bacterium BMA12]
MKIIIHAARWIVGLLFIVSGIIKVNDPIGTAIKMQEYFEVFATDIAGFFHVLVPYALFFAVFLSVLEVVLGIAVLINYRMRLTTRVLLVIIVFFTFLTFYSAKFNKVTDCGCFGDAIKLTPWESFSKDLVLIVLIGILFIYWQKFKALLPDRTGTIVVVATFALNTFLAIYAINHLPFVDFRAYKIGANLAKSMEPSEKLRYQYIMTKDGQEHKFDQYPTTGGYEYKDMVLLNPEAAPKITDYNIWNDEGDFTQASFEGTRLVIISYDVRKSDVKSFQDINQLIAGLKNGVVEPVAFTASDGETFENFRHEVQLAIPYYFGDATVLKTIIRSNPGIILLDNGVVKGKWHYNDVPDAADILRLTR